MIQLFGRSIQFERFVVPFLILCSVVIIGLNLIYTTLFHVPFMNWTTGMSVALLVFATYLHRIN
ncbi:hypothetical protein [Geomicrobium sp. JCM 19038]|uniref:hypothetical protein n=1 Tax=Geomicrobium sp. JCM 19038 TaxID=1460635 RepID=UPI00045F1305|nr:hypothetical protein [Geomicrobium sp. JCM 19038]GAK09466.1 hypothetical protein JCM19038_3304 [Geomicrobium sp. JCM 19038]